MALPSLLIMRKETPIQVYIQSPTLTRTQDGSDLPSTATDDVPWPSDGGRRNASRVINRVAEAFGKRYCTYQNTIRERNEGGEGNWGVAYTFAEAISNNVHSGLAVCNDNGQEVLAIFYWASGTSNVNIAFTRDGNLWEEDTLGTTGFNGIGKVLPWRNTAYWNAATSGGTIGGGISLLGYNFTDGNTFFATDITVLPNSIVESDLIVHKNNLFLFGKNAAFSTGYYALSRLTGTSWTEVWRSSTLFNGGWPDEHAPAMWTDPDTGDLILMFQTNSDFAGSGGSDNGFEVRQIIDADTASGLTDPTLPGGSSANVIDLSPTVVPAALAKGTLANGPDTLHCFVNNVDSPGTTEVYVIHNDEDVDTGGSHTYYIWNGVGSVMTVFAAATTTAASWVPVSTNNGGGERLPTIPAARPALDGGIVLQHGAVTSGPFVTEEVVTGPSGTARVRTVYSDSLDIEIITGEFLDTETITGGTSGASADLTADQVDLYTPIEIVGGATKHYFRVNGTGSAINLQIRISTIEEPPTSLATFIPSSVVVEAGSPTTTPTNTSSQILNVTPDSGSAIYSIQIDTSGEGLGAGEGYALMINPT